MIFSPFTSVTRWLLVVIGCVVLATAQPMSAADPVTPAPETPSAAAAHPVLPPTATPAPSSALSEKIIYPKGSTERPNEQSLTKNSDSGRGYTLVIALVLFAAGAWIFIQKRQGGPLVTRGPRKLQIEETRSLGNRQYLVVATYEGKKMLLGVTTNQIQLLTNLEQKGGEEQS